jgi:predicted nucleic-acid-binding protein
LKVRAIDTNVLVRALVQDDPAQTKLALALLKNHSVYVPVTVILELEWVLRSRYAYSQPVIAQTIEKLAALENLVMGERDAVISAAAKMARGWDFADALHHALSQGCDDFVTLDGDLAKRSRRVAGVDPIVTRL